MTTSGQFHETPLVDITLREDRQREEMGDIKDLADSILRRGLIHPIVITRDGALVAGGRRLAAFQLLGRKTIPAQYTDETAPEELEALELEENIKRKSLVWQEEVKAVSRFHQLMSAKGKWSETRTASALGMTQPEVNQKLQVFNQIHKPEIANADRYSIARGIVQRAEHRQAASILADIASPEPERKEKADVIQVADFLEWAPHATTRFNLIHCDFPYGVGTNERQQGTSVEIYGGYSDTPETYRALCDTFSRHCLRFSAESCHLVFWFSMRFYHETFNFLQNETPFEIDPFPLIWHKSDNMGLLPDSERGPRRTYETAFFGRRGDRKVVRAVGNSFSGPTVRTDHMSEKPQAMLEHFFRMLVDEHSSILDPTCGSGSALRAALACGAKNVLGLEKNEEFARRARLRMEAPDYE